MSIKQVDRSSGSKYIVYDHRGNIVIISKNKLVCLSVLKSLQSMWSVIYMLNYSNLAFDGNSMIIGWDNISVDYWKDLNHEIHLGHFDVWKYAINKY